jgi:hypothetical protein
VRKSSWFAPAFLGLVPVARSADLSAVVGWVAAASDVASDLKVAPVLRSWEQRFGAQVGALTDGIYLSVAAPPRTREHAEHLAPEAPAGVQRDPLEPPGLDLPGYVDRILGADLWAFWWDD